MKYYTQPSGDTVRFCCKNDEVRFLSEGVVKNTPASVGEDFVKFKKFGLYDYSKKGHLGNTTNLAPKAAFLYGRSK